jgi:hypothetical protein
VDKLSNTLQQAKHITKVTAPTESVLAFEELKYYNSNFNSSEWTN